MRRNLLILLFIPVFSWGDCTEWADTGLEELLAAGLVAAANTEEARTALRLSICAVADTSETVADAPEHESGGGAETERFLGIELKPAGPDSKGHRRLKRKQ